MKHKQVMDVGYATRVLKDVLHDPATQADSEYRMIVDSKAEVFARFQPIFLPERVSSLTREDFHDFLIFKNNRHWTNLHRSGGFVLADMPALRKALALLLDESKPIEQRITQIRPMRKVAGGMVSHLGLPVMTAVLVVVYPHKYGVWNTTSEKGMERCKVWNPAWLSMPSGKAYGEMNTIFNQLCRSLNVDLWTLDALWWISTMAEK